MSEGPITIVCVNGMKFRRNKMEAAIRSELPGVEVVHAVSYQDGISVVKERAAPIVLFEMELPFPRTGDSLDSTAGMHLIPAVQAIRPGVQMIAMSAAMPKLGRDACEQGGVPILDRSQNNFPEAVIAQLRIALQGLANPAPA